MSEILVGNQYVLSSEFTPNFKQRAEELEARRQFEDLFDRFIDSDPDSSRILVLDQPIFNGGKSNLRRVIACLANIDINDIEISEELMVVRPELPNGTLDKNFLYIRREGQRDESGRLNHLPLEFLMGASDEEIRFPEGTKILKVEEDEEWTDELTVFDVGKCKRITPTEALNFIKNMDFDSAEQI